MNMILLVLAIVAAGPKDEPPTGSRLGSRTIRGLEFSERDAAEAAQQLAQCLYGKRERFARTLLLAPTKQDAEKASRNLMHEVSCMNVIGMSEMSDTRQISFPNDILRGALAEAALKKSASAVTALQPLPLQKTYERQWFGITGRDRVIDEMGICVVETKPGAVAALLKTAPLSKEEGAAFGVLAPSFGPCLRVGAKLQANRQSLRAALADALFHRINDPAAAPPAAGATK